MKIKEGDILHCHSTLITDADDLVFTEGRKYKVEFVVGSTIEFINDCKYEHRFSTDKWHPDYYGQWFTYREEQLKKLLDD